MLALISPAKKLDFESKWLGEAYSQPCLLDHSKELAALLRDTPKSRLKTMMKLSDKLADLNYARYQRFTLPFTTANARPAVTAFRGDTYVGLDADTLDSDALAFTQEHLRILSGLYGLLRPLDLMQAYRLEMGTKLSTARGENLYDFWGGLLTKACNDATQGHNNRAVISLASNEYIKAIRSGDLEGGLITCHFKEVKDGAAKVIGLFAKRARGSMARHMIMNRIENPEDLMNFEADGYRFDSNTSDENNYVFLRERK